MVTAGVYGKEHLLDGPEKLNRFRSLLFELTESHGWGLQAWAIMSNHYHFVSLSPEDPSTLKEMIRKLHSMSAREINKLDGVTGRMVWYQYWDTLITYERSYFARLNYVHQNPVKHGVVPAADRYQWCSAKWFQQNASNSFRKTIYGFKTDKLNVRDDF